MSSGNLNSSTLSGARAIERGWLSSAVQHLPEHELQDAAVAVVVRLTGRVDPDHRVELDAAVRGDLDGARGVAVVQRGDPGDREGLGAGQAERLRVLSLRELQRQHAH